MDKKYYTIISGSGNQKKDMVRKIIFSFCKILIFIYIFFLEANKKKKIPQKAISVVICTHNFFKNSYT